MVNVKIIERTEIEREDDSGADNEQHERDGEHDIENDRNGDFEVYQTREIPPDFLSCKGRPARCFLRGHASGMGFSNFFVGDKRHAVSLLF